MGEDELATSVDWNQLAETLKWPAVLIIVILLFKKPLMDLINRITKFGLAGTTLEASGQKNIVGVNTQQLSLTDRHVGLYAQETIEMFRNFVIQESEVTDLGTPDEKIERLTNYSCLLFIMRRFDIIYENIFGSQIRLLQYLNSRSGSTKESVKFMYENAKQFHGSFYDDYSYEEYLEFLFSHRLIREENGIIYITILGVDFLKYLTVGNKNPNKLY